jgi:nucleotide-binding universal stress UspA family protein
MKVLIAYDGSECSDAAIMDLRRAGLPAVADVLVLSVAEISQRVMAIPSSVSVAGAGMFVPQSMESDASSDHRFQEIKACATQAADRLRADFPGWHIDTEAWVDSAGSAIIRKAHAWIPDLVVLGSHGRSGINRLLLGSVSQNVLHHVTCSVRISRHRLHPQERCIRLLIGVDGSSSAKTAIRSVAARIWPAGTEARVIGVLDSGISLAAAGTLEGAIPAAIEDESQSRMSKAVHGAAQELEISALHVTHQVLAGIPCEALLTEAEKWAADCVFVGARGLNGLERLVLGSVSSAVASKAHCSVEIVR